MVWFGTALACVIWVASWMQMQTEQQNTERDIAQETANLALVLEQNVSRTASEIDRILKFLRRAYERSGLNSHWPSLVQEDYTVNEQTVQIAIIDAHGMMITSSAMLYPAKPVNLSDREHYRVHAQARKDQLFISKPVVGRASGKSSVQFTRPFYGADGSFAGVIVVSLDPTHLSTAYRDLNLGDGGLAVIGKDDIIRAGSGIYAASLGRGLREGMRHGAEKRTANGTLLAVEEVENQVRTLAFRAVGGFPLTVIVAGRDPQRDGTLLDNRRKYLAGAALLSIMVILAVVGALRNRRRHDAQLLHLARHDSLTGLANRVQFHDDVDRAFDNRSANQRFALHLIDLDGFKFVNDTRGHPFGDKLLTAVAGRLSTHLRNIDKVARLGGDEFAIIQSCLQDQQEASDLARRVCKLLSEPIAIDGRTVALGASIGIALGNIDGSSTLELMQAADLALYSAKSGGRGDYRFYNQDMHAAVLAGRTLELELRKAVNEEQFEVHYQPIVDIKSREVTGYEALVRWRHPERGIVPPAEFIPLAEETGLIVAIGAWVLKTACAEMAPRPAHLKIAVNFSAAQFRTIDLVDTVTLALTSSGLAPERLQIEITESTLMVKDSTTIEQLQKLQGIGIQIVMDDFGTGYSSLSYLQSYPISCIKIDRSFVSTLGQHQSAATIIRAITTLASSLGMATIAEGVETPAQLEELTQLGCTEAQGYHFGKPQPATEALPAIAAQAPADMLAA
ncbi:MAG: EAL domain-containing protein [Rhodospirillales bacterium]|nr:EAL domain-containing protein [Rhodospirillales bacterium]